MGSGERAGAGESAGPGAGAATRRSTVAAVVVCALLALLWAPAVSMERAWGFDESMHAAYPSARMAVALREGAAGELARAVHDCQRYPFAYPLLLGAVQAVVGVGEHAGRVAGRLLWCAGLLGLFLLAREAARERPAERRALAAWLALALGALSPLALAYAGSWFLEVPFVVVAVFALRAWLRRGPDGGPGRELAAGAWLALGFFTKFNYGLLLGFALLLDLAVEAVLEARAGRGRDLARRTAWLALVPALGFAWWLLLPLPYGPAEGAAHRAALVAFLGENTDASMRTPWGIRAVHWTSFLAFTPRVLVVQALGALAALAWVRDRGVRTLWIALLGVGLPIWTHGFHQDRFLLAPAPALWVLAGVGLAGVLPRAAPARAAALAALAVAALVAPSWDSWRVLAATGMARPELEAYQRGVLAGFQDLRGGREVPTNGLARGELDAYLDLLEPELAADERVGMLGMSQAFSPAALWIGLMRRGMEAPAALRDGELERAFLTTGRVDLGWDVEAWARPFDRVLATDPPDLSGAAARAFLGAYREALVAGGGWSERELGTLSVARPTGAVVEARVLLLAPTR